MAARKKAAEVTKPGAYEWYDEENRRHLGFIRSDARGKLYGSFICEDGASKSIVLMDGTGSFAGGRFYGPLAHQKGESSVSEMSLTNAPDETPRRQGLKLYSGNYDGKQKRGVVARSKSTAKDLLGISEADYKNFFSASDAVTPETKILWDHPETVGRCTMGRYPESWSFVPTKGKDEQPEA